MPAHLDPVTGLGHVSVLTVRLPDDEMGAWVPGAAAILLDDRLTWVERRCTLEHELVHAERGDQCLVGLGPEAARIAQRQEKTADDIAARRLVALGELADALAQADSLIAAAEQLEVDEDTLWTRLQGLSAPETSYVQDRIDSIEERSWPCT